MGVYHHYFAIEPSKFEALVSTVFKGPSPYWDEHEADLMCDKPFNAVSDYFWKHRETMDKVALLAIFQVPDLSKWDLGTILRPNQVPAVVQALKSVSRDEIQAGLAEELDDEENRAIALEDYDRLILFLETAARAGHGIISHVG